MRKKVFPIVLFLFVFFTVSCLAQRNAFIPVPENQEHTDFKTLILMENIIESKNGTVTGNLSTDGMQANSLPLWLRAYISGGIEELERLDSYKDKYMFIAHSEGQNFSAMDRWAQRFSPVRDTFVFVASRIEKKLIDSVYYYPDDEYGSFFESIMKKAYGAAYPGAVKEDTYWLKMKVNNENNYTESYLFLVLISIDKALMQNIISNMILESIDNRSLSGSQRSAVNRLRQNFFEGF